MKRLSFFFLSCSLFAQQDVSFQIGYDHTDLRFSYENDPALQKVEEKWENIGSFLTKLNYSFSKQNIFYLKSSIFYSLPLSDHGSCLMNVSTQNGPLERLFSFDTRGYSYGLEQRLGCPLLIGPFEWAPFIGLFYENLVWKRRRIHQAVFEDTSFIPKKNVRLKNLLPLVGLNIFFQPWREKLFLLSACYSYKFGNTSLKSSYLITEEGTRLTITKDIERFSSIHSFGLFAYLKVTPSVDIGANVGYLHQNASGKSLSSGDFRKMKRQQIQSTWNVAFNF